MGGWHWDCANSKPDEKLTAELDGRANTFRHRVRTTTGVDVETMYYSAGYKDDDRAEQEAPYNLAKLLSLVISHTPMKKCFVMMDNVSRDKDTWKSNDGKEDYGKNIQDSLKQSIKATATTMAGATEGAKIGAVLGGPVGAAIGGAIGGIVGGVLGWFGW